MSLLRLIALLAAPCLTSAKYKYDPSSRVDPFDTFAEEVSGWLSTEKQPFTCKNPHWKGPFCNCLQNGNIKSWYQMAPFFYILDECSEDKGLVLRNGHMQDRHTMPIQAMMACDTLKLFSYCFLTICDEAIGNWTDHCKAAHYSVPGCDVDCSAAAPQAGNGLFAIAMALATGVALVLQRP
mmetsp:Transcript_74094/g.128530  ORF Transcript_74094/g.128530 Transcript_74094/m.128530 type:complete len:181 (-) Transcript_74094:173-715(-)